MLQDSIQHFILFLIIIIIISSRVASHNEDDNNSTILTTTSTDSLLTIAGNNDKSDLIVNIVKDGNSSQFENNNNNNKSENEFTREINQPLIEEEMIKKKSINELDSDNNGHHFDNMNDQVKTTTVNSFVLNHKNKSNELNITSDNNLINDTENLLLSELEFHPTNFPFTENITNSGVIVTISKQNNNSTEINNDNEKSKVSNESTFSTIISANTTLYPKTTTQANQIINRNITAIDENGEDILKSNSEISVSDTTDTSAIEETSTTITTFQSTQFTDTNSDETSEYTEYSINETFNSTKSSTIATPSNNDNDRTLNINNTVHLTNSSSSGSQPIEKGELFVVAASIASVLALGLLILLVYVFRTDKFKCTSLPDWRMSSVKPRPLSVKGFLRHCMELNETPARLASEFQLLASLTADLSRDDRLLIGRLPENRRRNRYINILPFDDNRVILHNKSTETSDYINASYIMGYSDRVEYIAAQGPKEETCQHFWQMVFDERVVVIAMVTQLEEAGREKCYNYYPKLHEQMSWDDETLIVYCVYEVEFPVYTARTLHLYKDNAKRVVTHLHFREWADFKVPETTESMIEFCQATRQHLGNSNNGLILAHCSAGVGRTGTLITVDILLQAVADGKRIDVFGTVYRLRHERMMMVQTDAQYAYIYKCIEDALLDGKCLNHVKTSCSEPVYENIQMNIINEGQRSTKEFNNQVNEYDDCHVIVDYDVDECTRILLPDNNYRSRFFIRLSKAFK